jgi:2-iminobutanoate/2-iminopropanoate deaminase
MRPVTDELLLGVAGVCATVIGLFLVGVLFFVEIVVGRPDAPPSRVLQGYMRAGTRIVIAVFAMALMLSLALVAFELPWATAVFVVLSLILVVANVDTAIRIAPVTRAIGSRTLLINEVVGTVGVLAIVALPWIIGGPRPSREDLALSALIALATAFISVAATALTVFDMARLSSDTASCDRPEVRSPPPTTNLDAGRAGNGEAIEPLDVDLGVADATRVLVVAGTVGLDRATGSRSSIAEQLGLIWWNLRRRLAAAQMGVDNVIHVTSYLRHVADTDAASAACRAALNNQAVPLRTIITTALTEGWLVEVELLAVADGRPTMRRARE